MASQLETRLQQYAEVIVRVGLNLQPGQRLLIGPLTFYAGGAPIEQASLVRAVVTEAYKAGARYVDVIWQDPQLNLIRLQHAPDESFEMVPQWHADLAVDYAKNADAVLTVYAVDPDLMADEDPEKMTSIQRKIQAATKPFSDYVARSALNWCVVSAPVEGWARKVLADVPAEQRMATFWDMLLDICKIKGDDPAATWQRDMDELAARADYLTQKRYASLVYRAPGTNLTIGLPAGHIWVAARLQTPAGLQYIPNIPTYEVFTMPHRERVDGVVQSTRPLPYGGTVIEDFSLTFEKGRVVKATAQKGEAALHKMLDTDEGARALGEVALVPDSSPISQTGRVFSNILFDENASCHLALGRAYRFTMQAGAELSDEEFEGRGGNNSLIHTDFMVGSAELDIDGVQEDGRTEAIFRGGEWAFEV
jgi:aminopeptidase